MILPSGVSHLKEEKKSEGNSPWCRVVTDRWPGGAPGFAKGVKNAQGLLPGQVYPSIPMGFITDVQGPHRRDARYDYV